MILQLFLGGRRSDGGVDWLGEVEGSSTRTGGWAGAVSEHGVGGAQREPGHRDRTGPWTRTRPAAVMDTGRLQTVHKTGALLEVNSILAAIFLKWFYEKKKKKKKWHYSLTVCFSYCFLGLKC